MLNGWKNDMVKQVNSQTLEGGEVKHLNWKMVKLAYHLNRFKQKAGIAEMQPETWMNMWENGIYENIETGETY